MSGRAVMDEHKRRWKEKVGVHGFLRRNMLTMMTILGVVLGTVAGIVLNTYQGKWSPRDVMYLQFPGELFLRMLKCLIIPLLVSSVVSAIGSLDLSMSKRIGFRAICFYMTTTVCAVVLGIILVIVIRPGDGGKASVSSASKAPRDVLTSDTLLDLLRNVFPPNLMQAAIYQHRTVLSKPINVTNPPLTAYVINNKYVEGTNVLGLVTFSVILGITIGVMKEAAKPIQDFFFALSEAMMIITRGVIFMSPIGVFFLVMAKILETENFGEMMGQLGYYFMTVMLGLFLHGFITLGIIFFLTVRKLPFSYLAQMGQVLATAFGTASSSATMPVTIGCMDSMGIDHRVSRFAIPIGATINMDGTALYEAVAAIFIAQLRSVPLSFGNIVAICVTATAASIGAAGIPQAGLVTMVMVLDTVGLPAEDVTIIIAVDWLLDRFRTTINVMCDMLGTIIIAHLSKSDIEHELDNDKANAEPYELQELGKVLNDDKTSI